MERPVIAVYDANVLYPAPLRDLLIRLAQSGLLQAKWTEAIHDEWMRNVLENNSKILPARLERTKRLMNDAVRDCVVSGYEELIETLTLPDPDDRHVLAAAIHAHADLILTFNLKDFPADTLGRYDIKARHPDGFLAQLLDSATELVCETVKQQRESLRKPPKTIEELLATFKKQGLTKFVSRLRTFVELL